jgi:hypothetical protein
MLAPSTSSRTQGFGGYGTLAFDRSEFAGGGMEEVLTAAMQYHRRGFVAHQPRLFGS